MCTPLGTVAALTTRTAAALALGRVHAEPSPGEPSALPPLCTDPGLVTAPPHRPRPRCQLEAECRPGHLRVPPSLSPRPAACVPGSPGGTAATQSASLSSSGRKASRAQRQRVTRGLLLDARQPRGALPCTPPPASQHTRGPVSHRHPRCGHTSRPWPLPGVRRSLSRVTPEPAHPLPQPSATFRAKRWQQPRCPRTVDGHTDGSVPTTEFYSARKRSEARTRAARGQAWRETHTARGTRPRDAARTGVRRPGGDGGASGDRAAGFLWARRVLWNATLVTTSYRCPMPQSCARPKDSLCMTRILPQQR